VGNCDGFVGNRCFALYLTSACQCVEERIKPEIIDQIFYHFSMGLFPTSDLSGNKIKMGRGI